MTQVDSSIQLDVFGVGVYNSKIFGKWQGLTSDIMMTQEGIIYGRCVQSTTKKLTVKYVHFDTIHLTDPLADIGTRDGKRCDIKMVM